MRRVAIAVAVMLAVASPAAAQARKGSWEIAPGLTWFSGIGLGSGSATLEQPGGGEFELFDTETRIRPAFGAGSTISFFLRPRLALEAGFSYARPHAATRVDDDAEDAPAVTAEVGLQSYAVEGSVRWYTSRPRAGWRPFFRGGGGYLRQLDDSNAHVETGSTAHVGIGGDRLFRDRSAGRMRRIGARVDARVLGRSGGFDVADKLRIGFAAGAAIFFGF